MSDNNLPAKRNAVSPPSFGYAAHQRPDGWLKLSDGSEWSIEVAAKRGLVDRDDQVPGNIFVERQTMPADAWIAAGTLDRKGADFVLALEHSRNPQPPVSTGTRSVEKPQWRPTLSPASLELAFVAAMRVWIESSMDDEADEKLALAFRRAVRSAAGMASR